MKRKSRRTAPISAREIADLDREFVAESFHPPSSPDRSRWERAKRKRGRPRLGRGVKVISVSVEKGLLTRVDRLAEEQGVSRARLITLGLRVLLAASR
jgi:hypothetical protein